MAKCKLLLSSTSSSDKVDFQNNFLWQHFSALIIQFAFHQWIIFAHLVDKIYGKVRYWHFGVQFAFFPLQLVNVSNETFFNVFAVNNRLIFVFLVQISSLALYSISSVLSHNLGLSHTIHESSLWWITESFLHERNVRKTVRWLEASRATVTLTWCCDLSLRGVKNKPRFRSARIPFPRNAEGGKLAVFQPRSRPWSVVERCCEWSIAWAINLFVQSINFCLVWHSYQNILHKTSAGLTCCWVSNQSVITVFLVLQLIENQDRRDIRLGREYLMWSLLQYTSSTITKRPLSEFLPLLKVIDLLYPEVEVVLLFGILFARSRCHPSDSLDGDRDTKRETVVFQTCFGVARY